MTQRIRNSKHTTTLIREQIMQEFPPIKTKNETFGLQHLVKLLKERDDTARIKELIDLFFVSEDNEFVNVSHFYWWYKNNQITKRDSSVYDIFDKVCETLNLAQSNPTVFSGRGKSLMDRIDGWKGNADNTTTSILIEYFTSIIPKAIKFNPVIVSSPKSLLGQYGWGLFEKHIEERFGGKTLYLNASVQDKQEVKENQPKLNFIQSVRDRALKDGDLCLYDQIGVLLTTHSILEIYQILTTK